MCGDPNMYSFVYANRFEIDCVRTMPITEGLSHLLRLMSVTTRFRAHRTNMEGVMMRKIDIIKVSSNENGLEETSFVTISVQKRRNLKEQHS
jgi:hypothetical protein